jgi:hypothetical protein
LHHQTEWETKIRKSNYGCWRTLRAWFKGLIADFEEAQSQQTEWDIL